MANYTPVQVMLALAFIADIGAKIDESTCETERELKSQIDDQLHSLAPVKGNWELVWGPYMFKFPLIAKYRDNTIFVVQNTQDRSQYTLALSGTNPYELTDWIFEDLLVAQTVNWKYGSPPAGAKVSISAALSLDILRNAKPCSGIPGEGQRLIDFLSGVVGSRSSKLTINVTGHSLGGEMVSTVALWLADTQGPDVEEGKWDPDEKATIYAYSYAGPTAGNETWASYFDEQLGSNTQRIWNPLDIVPHAWAASDLAKIAGIYQPQIKAPFWVKMVVDGLILVTRDKHYGQVLKDQKPLSGSSVNSSYKTFLEQVGYQHVGAYHDLLKVPELEPLTDSLKASAKPDSLI